MTAGFDGFNFNSGSGAAALKNIYLTGNSVGMPVQGVVVGAGNGTLEISNVKSQRLRGSGRSPSLGTQSSAKDLIAVTIGENVTSTGNDRGLEAYGSVNIAPTSSTDHFDNNLGLGIYVQQPDGSPSPAPVNNFSITAVG